MYIEMMFCRSESGNVLFIILIAVALYATLLSAVSNATRNPNMDTSRERETIDQAVEDQCSAGVYGALTRLKFIAGCSEDRISYELPDGTNANPLAPPNKSCHIFDPNGGSIAPCGPYQFGDNPCMLTLQIGQSCNGVVYAGISGGNRIYAAISDLGGGIVYDLPTYGSTGATSNSDGLANTNTLMTAAEGPYSAALACRGLGPKWYLPARDELLLLYSNRALIGNFNLTERYWSSTEAASHAAFRVPFATGIVGSGETKNSTLSVRCVRRD